MATTAISKVHSLTIRQDGIPLASLPGLTIILTTGISTTFTSTGEGTGAGTGAGTSMVTTSATVTSGLSIDSGTSTGAVPVTTAATSVTVTSSLAINTPTTLSSTLSSSMTQSPSAGAASSSSRSLPLGPIVGGSVAALALLLLFIFLLLRHRSSRREIRLQADPSTPTPFGPDSHVSINGESRSSPPVSETMTPPSTANYPLIQNSTFSTPRGDFGGHTAVLPPTKGNRTHLATASTSHPNSNQGYPQSNTSSAATREDNLGASHTYYNETAFTNIPSDPDRAPDSAPPAYDFSLLRMK